MHSPQQAKTSGSESGSIGIWSYTLIPLAILTILIFIVLYYVWFKRQRKDLIRSKRFGEDDESVSIANQMNGMSINSCTANGTINLTSNHHRNGNDSIVEHGNRSIQLIEKLSTGRFGSVWKAKMISPQTIYKKDISGERIVGNIDGDDVDGSLITPSSITVNNDEKGNNHKIVAVKIFPPHERSSWISEQLVFKTPQIEHENILRFLGSEKRDDPSNPNNEPLSESPSGFWLITEYHEFGSLCDYLKKNTVNIDQLVKISIGIAAGLNHLHYEIPEGSEPKEGGEGVNNQANYKMKPSIVHRDIKSRNVLLKADLTPRIADFGLALIFYPNRTPAGLGQVGTRRYMAPEVLEGAINYTQDSLYRIDVYACGLVLWELVSRCRGDDTLTSEDESSNGVITVSKYKLPFEEEVGQNPSLEDMQETVCQAKKRPIIQQQWLDNPSLKVICETIEECWDQDAEARLSASCILERFKILARNRVNTRF